jgi:hypothetical protein
MRSLYTKMLVALATALALSNAACTSASSCSNSPAPATILFKPSMVTGNIYESAPYGGPYTPFPGQSTVTFELDGSLGKAPYDVQFWLAFTPNGTLAPSSGNMTELVPDSESDAGALNPSSIRVYNDTCSDFYIQVVAEAPICNGSICDPSDAAAAGAAGASP